MNYGCILYALDQLLKQRGMSKKLMEEIEWKQKKEFKKYKSGGIKEPNIDKTERKQISKW